MSAVESRNQNRNKDWKTIKDANRNENSILNNQKQKEWQQKETRNEQ